MDAAGGGGSAGDTRLHLAGFSSYARAEVERILAAIDRLEVFPDSGRVVPEYRREDIREVIEQPYRLVYRRHRESVIVLLIFRTSRNIPTLPES